MQTGAGEDSVGSLQKAIKQLVHSKDVKACKQEDIEVYELGTTKANYRDGARKPLKPDDKLPSGSSSKNYIFVHIPRDEQALKAERQKIATSRPKMNPRGESMRIVGNTNSNPRGAMAKNPRGESMRVINPRGSMNKPNPRGSASKPAIRKKKPAAVKPKVEEKKDDSAELLERQQKAEENTIRCFYQAGDDDGTPDSVEMSRNDTVDSLKKKILNGNNPYFNGISNNKDIKIFLPDHNGNPAKELKDGDRIPDTSSSADKPLIVRKKQDCCYKLGDDGQPDSIAMMAGDSVASLKEMILQSNKRDPFMSGIKDPSDVKIFLPGKNGKPGQELGDNDVIPDGSSLDQPLVVKRSQDCCYKLGDDGQPDSIAMMAGDSVASLKEKILKSNKSDPFMSGIKKPSDVKIFLPGKNGKPGKELSDSDVIPDGSSLDQPLVVKRSQDCCYKLGDDGQPDSIAMMAGDSVASLKEKILQRNKSNPFMSGIKDPSDVKIFLPGKNGKPGKELGDNDVIPDGSSLDQPLVVKRSQDCCYKLGDDGQPDSIAMMADVKIFLPGKNGKPGKELGDQDVIPNGSSLDQPLVVKRSQDCCYKLGDDGQPDSIAMMAGDSVASLKEKILKSNKSDPFMSGIKKPSDVKIFLPGKNGKPGKEMSDSDVIPDGSSLDQPLVVKRSQDCCYKLGHDGQPDSIAMMAGDSVASLKEKILKSNKSDPL
ncbi:expressed unknown protein [Seminavis robusta]|uniref:Uncharacterized protein n=1 Tax=Seminavis robusta TaxID=568900 RepID=A0A9N8DCD7_9STRA|nr:expressed unknown protein [Seminavis robusta]|eukprot:Sro58_g033790.1 n/a (710) ;mRNA; r:79918-82253